jgi:hypothetical protein
MLKALLVGALLALIGAAFLPIKVYYDFYSAPDFRKMSILVKIWALPVYAKNEAKAHEAISSASFLRQQQRVLPFFYRRHQIIYQLLKLTRWLKVRKLAVYLEFGSENPAKTALAVGASWWLAGMMHSLFVSRYHLADGEYRLEIVPNYERQNYLLMDTSCIFEFALGHIMIIMGFLTVNSGKIRKLAKEDIP